MSDMASNRAPMCRLMTGACELSTVEGPSRWIRRRTALKRGRSVAAVHGAMARLNSVEAFAEGGIGDVDELSRLGQDRAEAVGADQGVLGVIEQAWLNQVELWFAKIERDVIARGVFTSVPDLKRKLMRYIRQYNKQPKPVKWKYFDTSRRITPESIVTVH